MGLTKTQSYYVIITERHNGRQYSTVFIGQLNQTSLNHGCGYRSGTTTPLPQPFYGPFSGTTRVSRCQKRTSGLYGARED